MNARKPLAIGFGLAFMGMVANAGAAPDRPPPPSTPSAQADAAKPSQNNPPVPPPAEAAPRGESTTGTIQAKPPTPAPDDGAPGGVKRGEIYMNRGDAGQGSAPMHRLLPIEPKPPANAPRLEIGGQSAMQTK